MQTSFLPCCCCCCYDHATHDHIQQSVVASTFDSLYEYLFCILGMCILGPCYSWQVGVHGVYENSSIVDEEALVKRIPLQVEGWYWLDFCTLIWGLWYHSNSGIVLRK